MDEQLDSVKEMNKRMMYGKVKYVRDQQIKENAALESEFVDQEKALYNMMEIERIKAIQDEYDRVERRNQAAKNQ